MKSVYVYYKPMPAYYEWLRVEILPAEDGNYAANVPVTAAGILYYFEAVDESGNAANYPDFLGADPVFGDCQPGSAKCKPVKRSIIADPDSAEEAGGRELERVH